MKKIISINLALVLIIMACSSQKNINQLKNNKEENQVSNKLIIYQLLPRLFGNKTSRNKYYGSIEENGTGKFNDITQKALQELKKIGITHVWYTGIIEHATMTNYSANNIHQDDPDVVKGRAGSPYAIKDYYDVDPDLAVNVNERMKEFENLIKRSHDEGLKVIIDFIPNHVARTYKSDAKPNGVIDFGANDDVTKTFSPLNDFYYIPNQQFVVPAGYEAGGEDFIHSLKDGKFIENPAKATGNDVFKPNPSLNDWFETIKLNYGIDYQTKINHFNPVPPVWIKTKDILIYWAKKGVDGFRCDVAEMVPVEFWSWVIPEVKKVNPDIIFIAEAYNPEKYQQFIYTGKFDYLYDKVNLYDDLKRLIKDEKEGSVKKIQQIKTGKNVVLENNMLRFLENHDEERIASKGFANNKWYAMPAMVVSATLSGGPVMIYMGQEVGEPGKRIEGFGGEDNRTTIFDYWGVPQHQKWMNNGAFDGALLNADEKKFRNFYSTLLNFSKSNDAIVSGNFYDLNLELENVALSDQKVYAYVRYTKEQRVLVINNFSRKAFNGDLSLSKELLNLLNLKDFNSLTFKEELNLNNNSVNAEGNTLKVKLAPTDALILSF